MRPLSILLALALSISTFAGAKPTRVQRLLTEIKSLLQSRADRYAMPKGSRSYLTVHAIDASHLDCQSYSGNSRNHGTESFAFNWADVSGSSIKGTSLLVKLRKQIDVHENTTMDGRDQHQVGLDDKVSFHFRRHSDAVLLRHRINDLRTVLVGS